MNTAGSLGRGRNLGLWPWVALCAALVAVEWARHGWLYAASDDPYIYLGYVKRVLTPPHELFSYNPGEHSAGTTGLLYYYLLIPVCAALQAVLTFLPLERVLLLGLWTTNVALFVLAGAVFLRAARLLGARGTPASPATDAALFLLFCLHPKFLWGEFSGLENPLAALLALVVVERLLSRAPPWQASLAAAGLCATRPETLVVLWVVPLAAAFAERPPARVVARTATAVFVWAGTLAALALPCRALTGRWFPSSLGARVTLAPIADPRALWDAVVQAVGYTDFWTTEWPLLAAGSLVLAWLAPRRGRGVLLATFAVLLALYGARAVLGLVELSVEDRYVSWVWPLHALALAAVAGRLRAPLGLAARPLGAALVAVALLAVSLLPLGEFLRRFERHVDLMQRIVVEPSLWMRANLPEGSRICMEPAGAIRLFTDFYLVDATGLTTTHTDGFRGSYPTFLVQNRIDYVFDRDYPGAQLVRAGIGRELLTWARGVEPWGDVRLWEVGTARHALLVRLAADGAADGSDIRAAFDNQAANAATAVRIGPSPARLEMDLGRPVSVDRIEVLVRATGSPPELGVWRVELGCEGAAEPRELVLAPAAPATFAVQLEKPCSLTSVRLSADAPAPVELAEVSLWTGERRVHWLDARGGHEPRQ